MLRNLGLKVATVPRSEIQGSMPRQYRNPTVRHPTTYPETPRDADSICQNKVIVLY